MTNINVIIKRPGEDPCTASVPNTLEALQELVGGAIEAVTLCSDLAVICNEEGRLIGLPHNCKVCGVDFVSVIAFVGVDGDEFADVPCDIEGFRALFPLLWEERKRCSVNR